jgi:hypothetical protein
MVLQRRRHTRSDFNPMLLHSVTTASAGSYQLSVSNAAGASVSGAATLIVGTPPLIVEDLTNQVSTIGRDVIFTVAASGSGPLDYQWVFNGTNVLSTVSGELILTNISSLRREHILQS